jgi:hypothetical protein
MEKDIADIDALFESEYVEVVNNMLPTDTTEQRNARMTSVVSKFASALTARLIHVSMSTSAKNPNHMRHIEAWSDAENIWFNEDEMGDLTDPDSIIAVKGISLHEVGHILFTPRSSSNLVKWVKNNEYNIAFNILEDQRLEVFLDAKYSNVKHWFTASITQMLLKDTNSIPYAYPLIHGRTFLPDDLRKVIKDAFVDQSIVAEIGSIIDDYTILNLSNSAHIPLAMQLIERLHKLLKINTNEPVRPPSPTGGTCGHPGAKSSDKSKTTNKAGQDRIIDKIVKKRNAQPTNPDGDQEAEGDPEPTGSNGGCGPKVPGKSPGQPGNQPGQPGQPGQPQDDTSSSAGTGHIDNAVNNIKKHNNQIKELLRDDVNDLIAQFNGDPQLSSKYVAKPEKGYHMQLAAVPADVVAQVKSFANQLSLIKADFDPGWNRKVEVGRLNVQRYATGVDADECFDQWDNGRDDVTDIEAVILLDVSGSMSWTRDSAFDSTWAIKRSLDKIDASTTVVTFDNDAKLLYSADERAKPMKKITSDSGGTEPEDALKYAKYVLANSTRAIKILITITDGEWYGKEGDKIIADLRRNGVITSLGFIDEYRQYGEEFMQRRREAGEKRTINGHNSEIVVPLEDGSSLLTLAKAIVRLAIKRNLSK